MGGFIGLKWRTARPPNRQQQAYGIKSGFIAPLAVWVIFSATMIKAQQASHKNSRQALKNKGLDQKS